MVSALDRRAVMLGTAAAAMTPAAALAVPADASPLAGLIEAHRWAYAAHCAAVDARDEAKKTAPNPRDHDVLIPVGDLRLEWARHHKEPQMAVREWLGHLRKAAASLPSPVSEAVAAEADRMEREALDAFARASADFEEKRRAHGIAAADEAWHRTLDEEDRAIEALCRYRPRNLDEVRTLAAYLTTREVRDNFDGVMTTNFPRILLETLAGTGGEART